MRFGSMRQFLIIIMLLLFIWSCSSKKGAVKVEKSNIETTQADSVEYDMETFDSKFETWYVTHNSATLYRTQDYYEYWNRMYVNAWNSHSAGRKNSFFEPIVGYDQNEDYGLELNHKLFYYFQYVEQVLKIAIMPGSPKVIPL